MSETSNYDSIENMISSRQRITDYLKKSIEKNRVNHAYLFTGPEWTEKKEVALWFAELLGSKKPDITEVSVSEDKKEISIEQIRDLRRYLSLSSHSSLYKVAIIEEADKMTQEASDALLKTLEEPRGSAILILISSTASALPETILSRCEEIKFHGGSLDKISSGFIEKEHIDILQRPINDIFKYLEKVSNENSEALDILDSWLFWFRDLLIKENPPKAGKYSKAQLVKIIKEIQKTRSLILNTNINQRLALENLVLEINV